MGPAVLVQDDAPTLHSLMKSARTGWADPGTLTRDNTPLPIALWKDHQRKGRAFTFVLLRPPKHSLVQKLRGYSPAKTGRSPFAQVSEMERRQHACQAKDRTYMLSLHQRCKRF